MARDCVSAKLIHTMAWPANRFTAVPQPVHCDGIVLDPTVSDELFDHLQPDNKGVCRSASRMRLTPALAFWWPRSSTYSELDSNEGLGSMEFGIGRRCSRSATTHGIPLRTRQRCEQRTEIGRWDRRGAAARVGGGDHRGGGDIKGEGLGIDAERGSWDTDRDTEGSHMKRPLEADF